MFTWRRRPACFSMERTAPYPSHEVVHTSHCPLIKFTFEIVSFGNFFTMDKPERHDAEDGPISKSSTPDHADASMIPVPRYLTNHIVLYRCSVGLEPSVRVLTVAIGSVSTTTSSASAALLSVWVVVSSTVGTNTGWGLEGRCCRV